MIRLPAPLHVRRPSRLFLFRSAICHEVEARPAYVGSSMSEVITMTSRGGPSMSGRRFMMSVDRHWLSAAAREREAFVWRSAAPFWDHCVDFTAYEWAAMLRRKNEPSSALVRKLWMMKDCSSEMVLGQLPPKHIPHGQLPRQWYPLDNYPTDNCPRTITPWTSTPQTNYPPTKLI